MFGSPRFEQQTKRILIPRPLLVPIGSARHDDLSLRGACFFCLPIFAVRFSTVSFHWNTLALKALCMKEPSPMKAVVAIIKPINLSAIPDGLHAIGIDDITICEALKHRHKKAILKCPILWNVEDITVRGCASR